MQSIASFIGIQTSQGYYIKANLKEEQSSELKERKP